MNPYKSLKIIGKEAQLSKIELRLLLILLGECAIDDTANISLSELSEILNTAKPNVSKALSILVRNNIVIRSNKSNRGRGAGNYNLHINFNHTMYPFSRDYDQEMDSIRKLKQENQALKQENQALKITKKELKGKVEELSKSKRPGFLNILNIK